LKCKRRTHALAAVESSDSNAESNVPASRPNVAHHVTKELFIRCTAAVARDSGNTGHIRCSKQRLDDWQRNTAAGAAYEELCDRPIASYASEIIGNVATNKI
jgi:hypothetical protein